MTPRNIRIIDPAAIRQNMALLREAVPKKAKIMAVVKADGYGHGAVTAARAALAGGAAELAVATAEEGLELRHAGIDVPVLVLGAADPRTPEERDRVLEALSADGSVRLTGAYTHFSDADGDAEGERYTERQFRRFTELTEGLQVMRHCANSAASLRHPEWALDMVREGISLYGYPPVETGLPLKPCMTWQAKISYIKEVPAGENISYGRTFRTDRPTRIATVTCGYGDGYHRSAGGKAEVLIRGKRARILGRICMDQMMADVTEIPEAREEDPVTLMGEDGQERITAEDLARWSGTISYEVLLSCGGRVERKLKTDAGPGK